jgi:hypothetical protein
MNAPALTRAIDFALEDRWDEAHRIVQDIDNQYAAWIHAVLHRIEGDESNSRYWYRRAGKEFQVTFSPKEELLQIRELL